MPMDEQRAAPERNIYYEAREAEVYDLEYAWKTDDIDFWVALAREYAGHGDMALELACGTGRVLVPVAESGVRVVGVDESPWMLEQAKKKYDRLPGAVQERIGLLEGDMRTLQLEQKFHLIYIPFNAFLILRTVEDQLAVFDTVRRHLAPGGVFALDIFVPDLNLLADPYAARNWRAEVDQTLGDLGIRLQRDMLRQIDPIRQQNFVTWRMKEYRDNVLEREWLTDLRLTYIFPRELEHLVARAGFEMVHYWGDYNRADLYSLHDPKKQLAVARPK